MQKLPLYPSPSKALHLNQLHNKITITQRTENYNNTTNIDFFFLYFIVFICKFTRDEAKKEPFYNTSFTILHKKGTKKGKKRR